MISSSHRDKSFAKNLGHVVLPQKLGHQFCEILAEKAPLFYLILKDLFLFQAWAVSGEGFRLLLE